MAVGFIRTADPSGRCELMMISSLTGAQREVVELREQVADRNMEIRRLNRSLSSSANFPLEWRLTGREQQMLASLYAAKGEVRTYDALTWAVFGREAHNEAPLIRNLAQRLRRKLRLFGIDVVNEYQHGYRLSRASVETINDRLIMVQKRDDEPAGPIRESDIEMLMLISRRVRHKAPAISASLLEITAQLTRMNDEAHSQ